MITYSEFETMPITQIDDFLRIVEEHQKRINAQMTKPK